MLGLVEAVLDGRPLALGGAKQRAVLAMLALHANERVSADRLIDGLWGERSPPSAPKNVQLYISQLRRLLEGHGAEIVTRGRGYELRLPDGRGRREAVRAAGGARRGRGREPGRRGGDRAVARHAARRPRRRSVRPGGDAPAGGAPGPRTRAAPSTARSPPAATASSSPELDAAHRRPPTRASGCTPSGCSRSTGPAARRTRWPPTNRRTPCSPRASAWRRDRSSAGCMRRSSSRIRRCELPVAAARPAAPPAPGRRPRRAHVLAGAAVLCLAVAGVPRARSDATTPRRRSPSRPTPWR